MSNTDRMPRPGSIFAEVVGTVEERKRTMPEKSYVATLLRGGTDTILCKIAEETGELVKAAREKNKDEQVKELCDLFFHSMVLMVDRGIALEDVERELARRFGTSGIDEKAARKKKG